MAFIIPEDCREKLELIDGTDYQTEDQTIASLQEYRPVTSEKNVWAYWHTGMINMPRWCRKNVIDWVRLLGPQWTVRVLDNVVDSPNNTLRYVPECLFPPAFIDRTMDGPYLGQHSADMTRSACLYEHGGAWMDVGSILFRHLDRICWNELEDAESPYLVAIPVIHSIVSANHFVAARRHNPFIYQWHRLFVYIWGHKKNIKGCLVDPLLAPVIGLMHDENSKFDPDWVDPVVALEYVTQIVCFTRLLCLENNGEGFSGVNYWQKHILAFSALEEDWRGEFITSFVGFGPRAYEALTCSHSGPNADPTSKKYHDAERLIWELLAHASMWKVAHGHRLTHSVQLGTLLDMPENEGKDAAPDTFGELLRYASVHLRQTRDSIVRMPNLRPSETWRKAVLEP
ncbi:hypothetical protein N7510_011803 [Penicillium lagena]|uniref:uncharacterized protein n=1 Tax=Penicillium lagena TaxID=94218 RepID=UPI00254237DB|nr:uncharacterized protein N7510_011803 [Penicillium lagena]KAJ5602269.1 hypothetical protein N7510_011803 [Penicillium lagena]